MPTTNSRHPLSPGAKERHRAHMESIRQKRLKGASYPATDVAEGDIELSDIGDRVTALEERVERFEDTAERLEIALGQNNQKLQALIEQLQSAGSALEQLQNARIKLDETAVEQITTHMEAAFLKASERSAERHAELIREHVLEGIKESLSALTPKGSGIQKMAAVMSIVGGVIVTAMAGTYAYAVFNYKPPEVRMTADGSPVGSGGAPLGA